jgi:hypothetical protein
VKRDLTMIVAADGARVADCSVALGMGRGEMKANAALIIASANSHADLQRERDALAMALRELMNWGVEFDDERLGYVSVQVNREAIKDAQLALGETK